MKTLIIGASAGLGRALSEILAARGDELLLVASDVQDLSAQAAHLRLVHGAHVEIVAADAGQPAESLNSILLASNSFGDIERVFFPIGLSLPDDRGTLPLDEVRRLLDVNLVIVVGTIGHFLPKLLTMNRGIIVGFGSVAAIRGRRANIVYAAAKRGLESYFESLCHLTAQTGVRVQFYKLGYVATQQSFGKKLLFPQVSPKSVAKSVVQNLGSQQGLVYFPRYWSIVSHVVSTLPWLVFKRLDF